jgi:hypothetical protein
MGKGTCVSLAFLKNTIFPLFSTKHVALRKTIAQEIAYHKQSIQTQSNKTNNWKVFVQQFSFIEMLWQERYGKGSWFVRYGFESLAGERSIWLER